MKDRGDSQRLRIQSGSPIVLGDDSFPADELVVLARERGGSVRVAAHEQLSPLDLETRHGSFFLLETT